MTDNQRKLSCDGNTYADLESQLSDSRMLYAQEQRRATELEDQLASMVQQNQALEKQLVQFHLRDGEPKSMHDEFSSLDEVR